MDILVFVRGVVINLFVMLGFVSLFGAVSGWCARRTQPTVPWVAGFAFGVMAVVAMLIPVVTMPGTIFDCRAAVNGAAAQRSAGVDCGE